MRPCSVLQTAELPGKNCPGCASTNRAPRWQPGAGGMCLHTILIDPRNPRTHVYRHLGGRRVSNRRRRQDLEADQSRSSFGIHPRPERRGRPLRAPNRTEPSRPDVLFMQKHWDVMRSDDAGDNWHEVSGNLPTDFGFAIDVHAHEPDTIFVVPIKSDAEHFPLDGKLRVYRTKTGGNDWEPLTQRFAAKRLLRQRPARRDGRRFARFVRDLLRYDGRPGVRVRRFR